MGELQAHNNDLQADSQSQVLSKQKLDQELAILKADLTEASGEVLAQQEHAKTGAVEAAKLSEELRAEQERSNVVERQKKMVEMQVKELQVKIEETEMAAMKSGPKLAAKLEGQLKAVETELENEQRRQADTGKNLAKAERRARELQFEASFKTEQLIDECDIVFFCNRRKKNVKITRNFVIWLKNCKTKSGIRRSYWRIR